MGNSTTLAEADTQSFKCNLRGNADLISMN